MHWRLKFFFNVQDRVSPISSILLTRTVIKGLTSHLRPGNLTALDDHLWLRAKVARLVQDQVRQLALLDRTDEMRHAVHDGAVCGKRTFSFVQIGIQFISL